MIRIVQFFLAFSVSVSIAIYAAYSQTSPNRSVELTGVNIAGAEFGSNVIPGLHGTNYIYPDSETIAYFAAKGMNVIRVPLLWERMQRTLGGEIDNEELLRFENVVHIATSKGMRVILDIHNYGSYAGSRKLAPGALGNLWRQLATRLKNNDTVIFGLMNEPTGWVTEEWLDTVNIAIAQIRKTGAKNLILVPGNGWSSARSWVNSDYGTANSKVMLNVVDPGDKFVYEVHQYFNREWTGATPDCQSADIGIRTLTPFTKWARENHKRGFLGEFGGGANPTCLEVLDRVLKFMAENNDVWLGWTYWAAGAWWGDYFTSVQPLNGKDRPQMSVLEKYTRSVPSPSEASK
jgi:endoglucanase